MSHLIITALLLGRTVSSSFQPSSLQSGPDLAGSSFASSVAYDRTSHSIVITGSTFGHFFSGQDTTPLEVPGASSDCFLATVDLGEQNLQWNVRKRLGDDASVPEACSSMIYHERHSKLIIAGHSERHGFMESLYNDALIQQATKYGFLLDIDVAASTSSSTDPFHLVGGRVLQTSRVNYPLAITSRSSDSWIYVASQETDSLQKIDEEQGSTDRVGTTFRVSAEVDPMRFLTYTGNYRLVLSRYQVKDTDPKSPENQLQHSFVPGWSQVYAIRDAPVHVAGIAEVGNVIVVAGTTNGTSPIFGTTMTAAAPNTDGSLDGFLSKFNKDSGRPIDDHPEASHRIQSADQSHDWVAGMCHSEKDDKHVYIVGATEGKLGSVANAEQNNDNDVEAFVMKINVDSLEEVWTRQIRAHSKTEPVTEARGVSCVVEGGALWIAGIVQDGAVLRDSGTTESYGNDDIFVVKLKVEDGTIEFVRQIGSTEDDSLAMRGALTLDKDGNCIVVGSTYGDMYRARASHETQDQPWISDLFVATISGTNGAMSMPATHPEFKHSNNNNNGGRSETAPPKPPKTTPAKPAPSNPEPSQNLSGGEESSIEKKGTSRSLGKFTALAVIFMAGLLFAVICINANPRINRDVATSRGEIIKYLHDFDVTDIDLKHSATGGWHCSYSNDLANGVNKRPPRPTRRTGYPKGGAHGDDPLLTAPLNDTLVRDSLFVDDIGYSDGLSRDGVGNSFELGDADACQTQGYDGLVEAYNSSWEENRKSSRIWGKDII